MSSSVTVEDAVWPAPLARLPLERTLSLRRTDQRSSISPKNRSRQGTKPDTPKSARIWCQNFAILNRSPIILTVF